MPAVLPVGSSIWLQVCTIWHAAAVAATPCIHIPCISQPTCIALTKWLQAHAASRAATADAPLSLTTLRISSPADAFEQQPRLVLPPASLSALRQLELTRTCLELVEVPTHVDAAAAAAAVTGLGGRLSTLHLTDQGHSAAAVGNSATAVSLQPAVGASLSHLTSLSRLTSLTKLLLADCCIVPYGLESLTGLRSLQLSSFLGTPGSCWVDLDAAAEHMCECEAAAVGALGVLTNLTHLTLGGLYTDMLLLPAPSSNSWVQQLTQLRQLHLRLCADLQTAEGCVCSEGHSHFGAAAAAAAAGSRLHGAEQQHHMHVLCSCCSQLPGSITEFIVKTGDKGC